MTESFLSKNEILAGGHVSHAISDHLSLAALVEEESRSSIVKRLIIDYLKDKPEDELITKLANRIVEVWNETTTFDDYLTNDVQPSLERRRISKNHIRLILENARKLNAANEKPPKRRLK